MVRFQEGGVLTKKVIQTLGAVSLLMLVGLFAMVSVDDSYAEYFDVCPDDDFIVKTGGTIKYETKFYDSELGSATVNYTAYLVNSNGDKQSGAVSPSTWASTTTSHTKTVTVTAPSTAGTYRLVVEYETNGDDVKKGMSQAAVKVVVPLTLSAEIVNNSNTMGSKTVMFQVDGKLVEGSEQTVEKLAFNAKKTVTYEWVTDSLGEGRHTYTLVTEDGDIIKTGEFYLGHKDYQWATIIMGILFVILLIALIYVVRKPVKNYGKPKGRR